MQASLKKTILIVIASLAGLLLLTALGLFLYFKFQFSTYQDDKYKFSISYPKSWKVIVHPKKGVGVVFLRPKDTAMDTVNENFSVTIQDLPDDIVTLEAFSARIKNQMTAVFDKNINIVEDKPVQWGWRQGHRFTFDAPTPEHLKTVIVWVMRSDKVFILTFLGDMYKYQQDALYVDEMIRSLQLQ